MYIPSIILLVSTLCTQAYGQSITKKSIVVNENNQPIPFANIVLKNKNIGTYSNQYGTFTIKGELNDTIFISCIAFEPTQIAFNDLKDTIHLISQTAILPELIISSKKSKAAKKFEIGYRKNKITGHYTNLSEAVLYIPNHKNSHVKICNVVFKIDEIRFNSGGKKALLDNKDLILRLTLYTKHPNKLLPDKNVAQTSLTQVLPKNRKYISFDISEWNFKLPPEGIFIGIEYVGYKEKDIFYPYDSKKDLKQFTPSFSDKHDMPQSFIRWNYGQVWKDASLQDNGTFLTLTLE